MFPRGAACSFLLGSRAALVITHSSRHWGATDVLFPSARENSTLKFSLNVLLVTALSYIQHISSFLLVCAYATSLGFSHFQQYTVPSRNISSCWPSPWGPLYFFVLSDLNWESPTEHNVFGYQPGEWTPSNSLSSQKSPSCKQCGLQWSSNMNLNTGTRGSCQCGLSELQLQWVSCHVHTFISAAGLYTICRRNMGFTFFVLKINVYWMRNYNVSIKKDNPK